MAADSAQARTHTHTHDLFMQLIFYADHGSLKSNPWNDEAAKRHFKTMHNWQWQFHFSFTNHSPTFYSFAVHALMVSIIVHYSSDAKNHDWLIDWLMHPSCQRTNDVIRHTHSACTLTNEAFIYNHISHHNCNLLQRSKIINKIIQDDADMWLIQYNWYNL